MKELSQHILDLIQNSISAGASLIGVSILREDDILIIEVSDNGCGMDADIAAKAVDPFYTGRTTRTVGLGLSLLNATAQRCDGYMNIDSKVGKGTKVRAVMRYSHIDRPPIGDIEGTMIAMIVGNPNIDFVYHYNVDNVKIDIDTRQIKAILGEVPINNPDVVDWLMKYIGKGSAIK